MVSYSIQQDVIVITLVASNAIYKNKEKDIWVQNLKGFMFAHMNRVATPPEPVLKHRHEDMIGNKQSKLCQPAILFGI